MSKNATKDMVFRLQGILPKKFSELKTGEELFIWILYHDIDENTLDRMIEKSDLKIHYDRFHVGIQLNDPWIKDSWVKFPLHNHYELIYFLEHHVFLLCKDFNITFAVIDYPYIKEEVVEHSDYFDWDEYDRKGLIEADKVLGYYKLSDCPEGVTRNQVPPVD